MDPITPITQSQPTSPASSSNNSNKKQNFFVPNRFEIPATQNLIDPTAVVNINEGPSPVWKSVLIDVCAVLFAGTFSYSFARYLAGGFSFWFVFAALLLWGSASVLEGFLQKSFSHRFAIVFLESLALVGFFYNYAWQALAITGIVVLFCLAWGYLSVRRELRNTIQIRFFTASGKVIGKVITAAVIFMIVMYASLMNDRGNFFVSENGFNVFFNWTAQFINNFYPTVPLSGSFGDFAQAVARMQLQGNPQFQSLTPQEQDAALSSSADQIMAAFSPESATSIPLAVATTTATTASSTVVATAAPTSTTVATVSPTEPANNVFYNYFATVFAKLQSRFGDLFLGAWGLILFLILRGIGIIAVWIAQFVALVFYEFLLAVGFMKITEETQSKELIGY